MEKCKYDCFSCPYPDCITDYINRKEIKAATMRDAQAREQAGERGLVRRVLLRRKREEMQALSVAR